MEAVKDGSRVLLHYEGKYASNDKVFDTNFGSEPLEVVVGGGTVIRSIDKALLGMKEGEEKTIELKPEDAFGQRDEGLVQRLPKKLLPNEEIKAGMTINMKHKSGKLLRGMVVKTEKAHFTANFNHFLAGQDVRFGLKIEKILEA